MVLPLVDTFLHFDGVLDNRKYSYYSNVSGVFNGATKFHNLTAIPAANEGDPSWMPWADRLMVNVNETEMYERMGTWNWAASSKIGFNVVDKVPPPGRMDVTERFAIVHVRYALLGFMLTLC